MGRFPAGFTSTPIEAPSFSARSVASGRLSGKRSIVGSQNPDSTNGCIFGFDRPLVAHQRLDCAVEAGISKLLDLFRPAAEACMRKQVRGAVVIPLRRRQM
jgi:hypothetical protein